ALHGWGTRQAVAQSSIPDGPDRSRHTYSIPVTEMGQNELYLCMLGNRVIQISKELKAVQVQH
ncbi:hypothetical protein LPJ81_005945, partial [Coemansia sp. IMI 209127]